MVCGKSVGFVFKTIKILALFIFTVAIGLDCFSTESIIDINYVTFAILAVSLGLSGIEFVLDIIAVNRLNILTQTGLDEKEKWKGLKNYMKDFSLLKEREIPSIVVWEKYLVYATVFGIAKEVIKQLKVVYPELENMTDNTLSTTNLLLSSNFNDTFTRSVNNSINQVMASGDGSGGGFSSGGGGGRRWWRYGWPLNCKLHLETSLKSAK